MRIVLIMIIVFGVKYAITMVIYINQLKQIQCEYIYWILTVKRLHI